MRTSGTSGIDMGVTILQAYCPRCRKTGEARPGGEPLGHVAFCHTCGSETMADSPMPIWPLVVMVVTFFANVCMSRIHL